MCWEIKHGKPLYTSSCQAEAQAQPQQSLGFVTFLSGLGAEKHSSWLGKSHKRSLHGLKILAYFQRIYGFFSSSGFLKSSSKGGGAVSFGSLKRRSKGKHSGASASAGFYFMFLTQTSFLFAGRFGLSSTFKGSESPKLFWSLLQPGSFCNTPTQRTWQNHCPTDNAFLRSL